MATPSSDEQWRDLVLGGMPPCWGLLAEGSGGSVWRGEGVAATIVPKAPERSVFNSVFYEDGPRLLDSLEEIGAAYEQAGVKAWTVWVPGDDTETAAALGRAGHSLDGEPRLMGAPLTDLVDPPERGGFEIRERADYAEMARINEIAYGYPPGDYAAVAEAPMPGARIYFAETGRATP